MTTWLRTARRREHAGWLAAAAALLGPTATLALLRGFPGLDVALESVQFHLAAVTAISACALVASVAAAVAARRTRQGALVVLAVGCLAVAAFMLTHGLTTPGILGRPMNPWVSRHPNFAVVAFALSLTVAATRPEGPYLRWASRAPTAVLLAAIVPIVLGSAATVWWPVAGAFGTTMPGEPTARTATAVAAAVILLGTGLLHLRRWQLGSDVVQLALVVASWMGVGAVLSLELGQQWTLAWWDYHVFLFTGFGAMATAILVAARRRVTVDDALRGAFTADPLEHISRGYSEVLRALVAAVEARDSYTHGHSARVAEWSVRIGQRLGLRPKQLRHLAEGAYLHDVGKIGIPDSILNKPGRLSSEERAWIEAHPVVGVDIAGRAPSLAPALAMIRHHHERVDGTGYPDRLAGDDIPLLARIVAVADVWDALTSDRAYRAAWPRGEALAHLVAGRGTHFDPVCLDALVGLLAAQGVHPEVEGEEAVAVAAAGACHADLHAHPPAA